MIASLDYADLAKNATAAGAIAFAFYQGWKGRIIAKATKVVAEETKQAVKENPSASGELIAAVLAPVLAKVETMIAPLATKDALDIFSARQDAFRTSILLEIGKVSEAGRQLGDQFPKFKDELNKKVDLVESNLNDKIADLHAKIQPNAGD